MNEIRNWIFRKGKTAAQWLTNMRTTIERKFGEAKGKHRLERCRYRGLKAVKTQCYLMAMALNLKRMAKMTC
jgi:IS5 family transposase